MTIWSWPLAIKVWWESMPRVAQKYGEAKLTGIALTFMWIVLQIPSRTSTGVEFIDWKDLAVNRCSMPRLGLSIMLFTFDRLTVQLSWRFQTRRSVCTILETARESLRREA